MMAAEIRRVSLSGMLALLTLRLLPGLSVAAEIPKGSLLLIGGALRSENAEVYGAFIELAGGKERARIGILPTACNNDKPARRAADCLVRCGVASRNVMVIDITEDNAAERTRDATVVGALRGCTGVFIAGGDQRMVALALLG